MPYHTIEHAESLPAFKMCTISQVNWLVTSNHQWQIKTIYTDRLFYIGDNWTRKDFSSSHSSFLQLNSHNAFLQLQFSVCWSYRQVVQHESSSIARTTCLQGQGDILPVFAFFPDFYLSFLNFAPNFPLFLDFFHLFSTFCQIFLLRGHSIPLATALRDTPLHGFQEKNNTSVTTGHLD